MDLQDLERMIQDVIPAKLDSFPKLREEGDPYHFKEWDGMGQEILRYWFWNRKGNKKNSKRVFINEIGVLVKHCIPKGTIERSDFELYCPKTNSDGDCGFAVIGRILEFLSIAKYDRDSRKLIVAASKTKTV